VIQSRPDIAVWSARGLLSFHSAAGLESTLLGDEPRPLILRMKDVHHVDTSGLLTLEAVIAHRRKRGARTLLTAIQPEVRAAIERFGVIEELGPGNVFLHTRCAIESIPAPQAAHPA
jgi:anti-anti-sigma regulatory factor